ncbi:hypothetical protein SUGI_0596990 [Cryptomeria japonica]|nr:hypothetical protein SUGI_0596990 [Cryptomeria japonica]
MVPDLLLLLFVLIHASLILSLILVGVVLLLIGALIVSFLVILWLLVYDLYKLLFLAMHCVKSVVSCLFWFLLFFASLVVSSVVGIVNTVVGFVHSVISEYGVWTDYNTSSNCSRDYT